jgi:hypothetical protein
LGGMLKRQGQFADALAALKRGHELGSRTPGWPYPSAEWVRDAEHLVELDARLPLLRKGETKPASASESVEIAALCQEHKALYVAAVRFFQAAFTVQPGLADELGGHRYNAACAAALAGCGQGQDASGLEDQERARLRRQALDWLRADLDAWRKLLEKEPAKARPDVLKTMEHWLADSDFAGVRGEAALGKLSEAERVPWQKLWEEVKGLKNRAAGSPKSPGPATP